MLYKLTPEELTKEFRVRYRKNFKDLDEAVSRIIKSQEYDISQVLKSLGIDCKVAEDDTDANRTTGRRKVINPDPLDLLNIDQLTRDFVREVLSVGQMEVVFKVELNPILCEEGKVKMFDYKVIWFKNVG